ncbi:MAG: hypothetical protein ABSE73_16440 [Planctomycetota bacterium]
MNIWGIQAKGYDGKDLDAWRKFLEKGCVGIGWRNLGDISSIVGDVEALRSRFEELLPPSDEGDKDWTKKKRNGCIGMNTGLVHRFVSEMQKGGCVIFPTTDVDDPIHNRCIHIGVVTGPYRYDPDFGDEYTHFRPVKWLHRVCRDDLSDETKDILMCARSFQRVQSPNDEVRKIVATAADGSGIAVTPGATEDYGANGKQKPELPPIPNA